VDAVVSPNELVSTARQWALDIFERRRPWIASLYKTEKLDSLGEAREIFKFARAQAQKRAPNLLHPIVCINVVEHGIVSGPRAGLYKVLAWFFFSLSSNCSQFNCFISCLMLAGVWKFPRTCVFWHQQELGPHLLCSARNNQGSSAILFVELLAIHLQFLVDLIICFLSAILIWFCNHLYSCKIYLVKFADLSSSSLFCGYSF